MAVPRSGGSEVNGSSDSTARIQRPLRPRVWRSALAFALAFALPAGCENPAPPTLQDAGKNPAELRGMLSDPEPQVQARGALGLSLLGAEARDAVPELIPLLKSPNALARQNAALALASIGPGAKSAVAALADVLRDHEWAVRRQAAIALGAIGPEAKPAIPSLKRLDTDPQKLVRDAAKQARAKIEGK